MNTAEAEQGCQEGIRSVGGGNVRLGEETFGSTVGGKALEAGSGRTQVRRREGVRRADRAHHWSVVVPGCEEMGGGEFHALGLCPRHPKQQTQPFFFVQAIDDIGLTIQSIHRLKECVADPPEWESQQKDIPGRANQKR